MTSFKSFDPKDLKTAVLHEYLLATVAPRPIAWASTVDKDGNVNLAPFSFFNVFGSNPPTLIFSPSRRVRDNTTKHTLANVLETKECVVNIVNYDIVGKMILTSAEYPGGANEFEKAGLTMAPSVKVKAPRVAESPAQFECKVKDVIALGEHGGAGNLIICEIVHLHLNETIFDENGEIPPTKVDNVARMGRIWYTRAAEGIFQFPNPKGASGGLEEVPSSIRESRYLTGSEIAKLAGISYRPTDEEIEMVRTSSGMQDIYDKYAKHPEELESKVHSLAKTLLAENKIEEAWRVLLSLGKN